MTKGKFKVPYDVYGNLMKFISPWHQPAEWRENTVFKARLQLVDWYSEKAVLFKDVNTGVEYPMFLTNLIDLIKESEISQGVTYELHWVAVKRCNDYGIRMAEDNEIQG